MLAAAETICAAVERYKDLCEGRYKGAHVLPLSGPARERKAAALTCSGVCSLKLQHAMYALACQLVTCPPA